MSLGLNYCSVVSEEYGKAVFSHVRKAEQMNPINSDEGYISYLGEYAKV